MDPEIISTVRFISLVLFCLLGIAPSAIDIIKANRK